MPPSDASMSSRSTTGDPYLDLVEEPGDEAPSIPESGGGGQGGSGSHQGTPSIYISNGSRNSSARGGRHEPGGSGEGGGSGRLSAGGGGGGPGSIRSVSASSAVGASRCSSHPGEVLSYFCQSCEAAVCHDCVETSHGGHTFTPLSNSVENQRDLLEDCARLAAKSEAQLLERIEELDRILTTEDLLQREVAVQIDSSFQMIERMISQRKTRLHDQLAQRLRARRESIEILTKELNERASDLTAGLAALRNVLSRGSDLDVLSSRRDIGERLIRMTKMAVPLHPGETDTVAFVPTDLDQLFSMIHRVGLIAVTSAQPDKTRAVGQALKACQIHNQETITVVPRDEQDRPVDVVDLDGLSAHLSTPWEKAYQVRRA